MNSHFKQTEIGDQNVTCELCIIGAGIAGLNALFVASKYLSKNDKVILVDKNPSLGGMWNETYGYVRLHQPHKMFTAGDIEWKINREPSYLASKHEVLTHFEHCIEFLRSKVTLIERYGWVYEQHTEVPSGDGYEAHIHCTADSPTRHSLLIKARRCIKAIGLNVPTNSPISLSSAKVNSVAPQDAHLFAEQMDESDKPIYIIGGGKTAMDTAHALLARYPQKEINLVVGKGTVFFNRNKVFPIGLKRWWGGTTSLDAFLDLALMFNGDNEAEVFDYFKKEYAVFLDERFERYLFGIMSVEENEAISKGVNEVLIEYMTDIVDADGQTTMLFRSGQSRVIESGSWVVNCTGYIMRKAQTHEPYLSANGTVVSIQPTSSIHFLTSFAASGSGFDGFASTGFDSTLNVCMRAGAAGESGEEAPLRSTGTSGLLISLRTFIFILSACF
jgi:thioredoxin reductase